MIFEIGKAGRIEHSAKAAHISSRRRRIEFRGDDASILLLFRRQRQSRHAVLDCEPYGWIGIVVIAVLIRVRRDQIKRAKHAADRKREQQQGHEAKSSGGIHDEDLGGNCASGNISRISGP